MNSKVDLRELAIERDDPGPSSLAPRRHLMTRLVIPSVFILGFIILLLWASRDLLYPPLPVTVVPTLSTLAAVREEGTPLFKAAGWIEPRPTPVRVAALAPGVIEQLFVVEDQRVSAGEPIAKLVEDDARLHYELTQADLALRQAELGEAQAALTAAETHLKQPVHLQAALGAAEASLAAVDTELKNLPFAQRRAEADLVALRKDYEGKLAAQGVIAGVAIDIAKGKADSAKAMVEELRDRKASLQQEQTALSNRRNALKTQLELLANEIQAHQEAEANVQAGHARIAQARAAVAIAKLRLDRMTVVSPIDGRIFRLIAHPGARIGSGMTQMTGYDGSTVVTMYRPNMLQVRVDVRFEDIPKVSFRQAVTIDNPALPKPLVGDVLFISSEADIQKNTLQVKVAISEPPPVFKPEMLVDVTFLAPPTTDQNGSKTQQKKLFILQQLIHRQDGKTFVWLADQSEGVAHQVNIQTGPSRAGGLIEVTQGLTEGSRVISGPTDGLHDGRRIRVTGEDTSLGTATTPATSSRNRSLNRLPSGGQD